MCFFVAKCMEGAFPKEETKREVMECVLSLVLQGNPTGYIKITLLPDKTGGVHSRKKRQVCLSFYRVIFMDRIDITMFPTETGGVHPRKKRQMEVIECVLSLVLQGNPTGYINITLFPGKLMEHIPERRDKTESN